jgi:hypothetical protein
MKPKIIPLLENCVEVGIKLGYNRAHKHNDNPDEKTLFKNQLEAVMHQFFERFDFEELNG